MGIAESMVKSDDPPMVGNRKRSLEMKRELSDMGMYEDGMSSEEMQQLLSAVNASKGQAEMHREDSGMQIESPPAIDQDCPERSTSKFTKRTTRDSTTPDPQPNVFSNKNKDRKKSPEIDSFCDSVRSSETLESKRYISTPSPPQTITNNAPTFQENQKNITMRKNQQKHFPVLRNNEKWRIDPLDCKRDDDPPLRARSNGGKAPPIKLLEIDGVPQIPEDIRKFISNQLTEVSRNHFINNKEFYEEEIQWGLPIKVGIANGSLDKNPRRERSQTPSTSQEVNDTTVAIRAVQIDENRGRNEKSNERDVYVFGDDEEGIFHSSKKKPRMAKCIPALPERPALLRRARTTRTIPLEASKDDDEEINPKDPDWGNSSRSGASRKRPLRPRESAPDLQKKREQSPEYDFPVKGQQKSDIFDYVPSSQSENPDDDFSPPVYPRKVTPPNPSRPKSKGGGKKLDAAKLIKNRPELDIKRLPARKKKEPGLSEDEIQKAVESPFLTDDEDEEPIFVSETTGKRTQNAVSLLLNAKKEENDEKKRKEDAEKAKKAKEASDRQDRVQRMIREENAKQRAKQALEEMDNAKTQRWSSGMKTRNSGKRPELDGEQSKQKTLVDWAQKNSDDVEVYPEEPVKKVECPMCGKLFPEKDINEHAFTCSDSQMETNDREQDDVKEVVDDSSEIHFCQACEKYQTRSGNEFQHHVSQCLHQKDRAGGSQSEVMTISDSPPRSNQSKNKQENSESDYHSQRQYPRRVSPRTSDNRKRKRFT